MKIRIIKNSKPKSWYKDMIGEEFEVLETNEKQKHYIVEKGRILNSFIEFEDCEIINEIK